MAADSASRTLVLSVVSVDLVGYSRKSVAEQMSLKDNFNQLLLEAIHDIPVADRIILDTGDGVAMGFLGDPEDALYVAMFMHRSISREVERQPGGMAGKSSVERANGAIRIGINLGPVKLAVGVGGQPNIIGDGINVAERIMAFAQPGQLTASRPFFEIMSRMSGHYATLFEFAGVHTDKQVRAHDVYLVGKSVAAFQQAEQGVRERAAQRAGLAVIPHAKFVAASVVSHAPKKAAAPPAPTPAPVFVERHAGLINFLENRKKVAAATTLLAMIAVGLGTALAIRKMQTMPPENRAPLVIAVNPTAAKADVTPSAISPPPVVKPTMPPVVATVPTRDEPQDTTAEKSERADKSSTGEQIREKPRKTPPPRVSAERERSAPITTAPAVSIDQAPVQVPQTESVAPVMPTAPAPSADAVVVSRRAPPFPVEGIRQGIQTGLVKARLTIDARGNVTNVEIVEAKPIPAFGRETRLTLKDWKFNPGVPNRTYDIEISFKL